MNCLLAVKGFFSWDFQFAHIGDPGIKHSVFFTRSSDYMK